MLAICEECDGLARTRGEDAVYDRIQTTLLQRLDVPPQGRGVAVAVDGEVVPREQWGTYPLTDDARVEVLSAMQGG